MTDSPPAARVGAWTPLRSATFRALFLAMIFSNIGVWMQMVGSQWLLLEEPNATQLVALIQTVMTLPMALFALPAGVIADAVDRRRMLIVVQSLGVANAALLAVLVVSDLITPVLLLALLAGLATVGVFTMVPFQAVVGELVPKLQVQQAAALIGVSANIARAVGPAFAGVLIANFGIPLVFVVNAFTTFVYLGALLLWKREPEALRGDRERFVSALRSGTRYVRHSPHMRNVFLRLVLFAVPAQAIWALLPLVATRQLGLDVGAYGILLGALGIGAVSGASALPLMRQWWRTNGAVFVSIVAYALATAGIALSETLPQALPLLFVAGFGWIGALSGMAGSLQLYLPTWVRARGIALNMIVLFGSMALGSTLWGLFADMMSLPNTYWLSAGLILAGSVLAFIRPLRDTESLDRTPANYWPTPDLALDAHTMGGQVRVDIIYNVAPENVDAFCEAIAYVRIVRLRTGARDWDLYRDVETPERFVESYRVGTWEEHMRQHELRLTESDRALELRASELSRTSPVVEHLIETRIRRI